MTETVVYLERDAPDVIIRPMLTVDRAVDYFLGDLTRRGCSERTTRTYARILDKLCDRLPDDYDVSKITTDDCRRFLDVYQRHARGTQAHVESVLSSFLKWLYVDGKIARNPIDRLPRTRRIPSSDLDVVTTSTRDVQLLLRAARGWSERIALGILCYMGPRRRAVARLRLRDFDREHGRLRFQEKGSKIIWKPVPDELRALLEAAIADGAIVERDDYLVPPEGYLQLKGERDDRIIWRLVKRVATRAGVETHVHALRAAFAVYYLEQHPGDVEALRELLGHRSVATTQIYLRKLDRQVAMERVRDLSWAIPVAADNDSATPSPQAAENGLEGRETVGAGGFEPPFADFPDERPGGDQLRVFCPACWAALHGSERRAAACAHVPSTRKEGL